MTFRCADCNRVSQHHVPAKRVVTQTRAIQHPYRKDANRNGSEDPGGTGTAIVSEKLVCGCKVEA